MSCFVRFAENSIDKEGEVGLRKQCRPLLHSKPVFRKSDTLRAITLVSQKSCFVERTESLIEKHLSKNLGIRFSSE